MNQHALKRWNTVGRQLHHKGRGRPPDHRHPQNFGDQQRKDPPGKRNEKKSQGFLFGKKMPVSKINTGSLAPQVMKGAVNNVASFLCDCATYAKP